MVTRPAALARSSEAWSVSTTTISAGGTPSPIMADTAVRPLVP
jgi:hypothetical protein